MPDNSHITTDLEAKPMQPHDQQQQNDLIPWYILTSPGGGVQGLDWVQDGKLFGSIDSPYVYPYNRLAWTNDTGAAAIHVYHQLSNNVLAEDSYYFTDGWASTNIMVGVST